MGSAPTGPRPVGAGSGRMTKPTPPDGEFTQVSAGREHTCGIRTDQTVSCWGGNSYGQGDAPDGEFTEVSAGDYYTCGIRTDQTPTCWGGNSYGQGDAPSGQFIRIAAGVFHTCGIRGDRTVSCWGRSRHGLTDAPDGEFTEVSAGDYYTCGIRVDGAVSCWGGISAGIDPPDGEFTTLGAGNEGTCGLRADRTITCWQQSAPPLRGSPPEGEYTTLTARGEWSSPRWPDTSTKSAFDVREWTQRVGKESCWEGNDREGSSPMSSNVTRWRSSAALANRSARSPTSWGSMTRLWVTGCVRMGSTGVSGKG